MIRLVVLTCGLALAACGSHEAGPTCEESVAKIAALAAAEEGPDAQFGKARDALLTMCKTDVSCEEAVNLVVGAVDGSEGIRGYSIETCKRQKVAYPWRKASPWPASLRACIVKASSKSDFEKCMDDFRRSQSPGQPATGEKALASFKKFVETMYPGTPFSGGPGSDGKNSCRLSADVTKSDSVSHPFKGHITGTAISDGESSQVDAVFVVDEFGEWSCLEMESRTVNAGGVSSLSGCTTLKNACEGMSVFSFGEPRIDSSAQFKTLEATTNVKRIYDAARAYYEEDSSGRGSQAVLPKQFPATPAVATVPALGACCAAAGKKCAPSPALWTDPTWQALNFSMDDPHYYSYTYISTGTDVGAQFTVRANGDLDCDGIYSTFEMVGSIQADGTVTGQAGFFKDRELE